MLGIGQGSLQETHGSSSDAGSHKQLPSTATSLEALHPQEPHTPYQDYIDSNSILRGAHDVTISGQATFVNKNNIIVNQQSNLGGSQAVENFKQFVSFEALHDSKALDIDRDVYPVIRAKTLEQSRAWIDNPNPTEQIAWLHGPASIGKTAIALEIAQQKNVVATFFFSRRSDENRLLPTLAWQLARSIPEIHNQVIGSIVEHPDLLDKRLEEQFKYLVAQPFAAIKKVTSTVQPSSLIVIIDGIDQCADRGLQRKLLNVIGKAILNRLVPLRFVICSRTDPQTQKLFDQLRCPVFFIDLVKFGPAEEFRKREEEQKKREESLKKQEEGQKKREESLEKREEEQKKLEVSLKKREEEQKKREESLKKREEEVKEFESHGRQQLARMQEELKKQEENLKKRAEVLELRDLESHRIRRLQEEQQHREEELRKREEATSLDTLNHQESPTPYQDYMDPSYSTSTIFQGAKDFSISGQPNFAGNPQSNPGGSQAVENFKQFISFEALHDSNALDIDRDVHPGIRAKTLKQLQDWMDNPNATEQIAWLHGPASIGKTAIALEIAQQKNVVATFFFSRLEPSRSDGNRLLPTLAWQLARSIPEINSPVIDSIINHPKLLNKRLDEQFEYLVAQPFAAMKVTSAVQPSSLIVIVDGIDECADIRFQQRFLRVIGKAILERRVPLRFVICSRTGAQIQTIFDQWRCPTFSIDLAKFGTAEEIRKREENIENREEELKKREEELKKRELERQRQRAHKNKRQFLPWT